MNNGCAAVTKDGVAQRAGVRNNTRQMLISRVQLSLLGGAHVLPLGDPNRIAAAQPTVRKLGVRPFTKTIFYIFYFII